uniref:uncharacterized protein LOC127065493 isoform X2 n=1 Tax=Vespula vulgaris TaxID=7454 RepID=UPI00223AF1A6|nr:uncharacterized protein LOC127065493 isoform X2 [Vespula vulgaris]
MVEGTQTSIATWCPICDKRVSDKGKDTDRLLGHVRRNHRKISALGLDNHENGEQILERQQSNGTAQAKLSNTKEKDRKRIYTTRVDTWKSHDEKKICPQCRKELVPALHTRRHNLTTSHMAATCLLGCWPLCFVPLMLSRERQVRLVCPFCGHNYGNYAQAENKSDDPWHPRRGQRRLVEITSSKLDPPSEREHELNPNSELAVLAYQGLWEVRDASEQTENVNEREGKEEEEERGGGGGGGGVERGGASVSEVLQYPNGETMFQPSEGCTLCSRQVTGDRFYETHLDEFDLDYDSDWSMRNRYRVKRNTRPYDTFFDD